MSTYKPNRPLPIRPPPGRFGAEFDELLSDHLARAWARPSAPNPGDDALRDRLRTRLASSRAAEAVMFTARRRQRAFEALGAGVRAQTLYSSSPDRALRPGEPSRVRLIELGAAARLLPAMLAMPATGDPGGHCEWLVLAGVAQHDEEVLSQRDYHVTPGGHDLPIWTSPHGALLFLRESGHPALPTDLPHTVRDADAGWPEFAPGICRRVLWQRDGQAAMLYYAQPGALVPEHAHGHDEECLMVQGELFLDDLLLQPGDYQLSPAGTGHGSTATDTGAVVYAHGDIDLRFVP